MRDATQLFLIPTLLANVPLDHEAARSNGFEATEPMGRTLGGAKGTELAGVPARHLVDELDYLWTFMALCHPTC
jgi:hypothetical protein